MNLPEYQKKFEAYEALTEVGEISIRDAEHTDTQSFDHALIVSLPSNLQVYLIEYINTHQAEILAEIKETARVQLEADRIAMIAETEAEIAAIKKSSL